MLTEKRRERILQLLKEKNSVTVTEIKELLDSSESTIRRDLNALDQEGKLVKVFGGAVLPDYSFNVSEPSVSQKLQVYEKEKREVARYAASLLKASDFIYLDAGTTTGYMIDYLTETDLSFVTNAVDHAKRLAVAGYQVILLGGVLKGTTEAVVGSQAILSLQEFHFSKGFFGTNGLSIRHGMTTPDSSEASVKKTALRQCKRGILLADFSKYDQVSSVTFADFEEMEIISDRIPPEYDHCSNIVCCGR